MQELDLTLPQLLAVSVLPILFAITVHEVAHGWVAKRFGDPTAERLGRLTLNPLKHIDPVGTVLVPGTLILMSYLTGTRLFIFGWARPVPVTWENLRRPKRDMVFVAAAGPVANLLMAIVWGLVARGGELLPGDPSWATLPMYLMGEIGIFFNVLLMVFNLLPLPPLDGGRVAVGLLPGPLAWRLSRMEPYGFFILIGLMVTGLLWVIVQPMVSVFTSLVHLVVGL
jgi:Zn-dependent protease